MGLLLCVPCLNASDKQKSKQEKSSTTSFHIAVDLVSVSATVTDKKGAPIKDLTANDFQIFEDGVPQKISVFKIEAAPGVAVPIPNGTPSESEVVTPMARKVILFVDDYHIAFENLVRLKKAGETFIRNGLGPNDLVALITASGKNSTEFTKYRDYVITNLNNVFPISSTRETSSRCPPLTDYQAAWIVEHEGLATSPGKTYMGDPFDLALIDTIGCENLQGVPGAQQTATTSILGTAQGIYYPILDDSRRTLYSMQALARRLKAIEGEKTLVLLSDGFLSQTIEHQIQDVVDASIRANTVIESINTVGLSATPPGGDASTRSDATSRTAGDRMRLDREAEMVKEDPLNAVAHDTGGEFFHNNNDLLSLMNKAVTRSGVIYLLGYYSTNNTRNGLYRKLSVKVSRPDVLISARKGYYAPKGDEDFQANKNEDVREALASTEDLTEIPVSISLNVSHEQSTRSSVAVQTRVDVRKIHFQKRENRNRNIFTIVTVVYDANNQYVEGRETDIDFNLTDPNYKNVMEEGLRSQARFELGPGNYRVRAVVREAGETKMGTATKTVEISN